MLKYLTGIAAFLMSGVLSFAGELQVTGEGSVSTPSSVAYLSVSVVSEAVSPSTALSLNGLASSKIMKTLKTTFNLKDNEIQTAGFNISAKYVYDNKKEPELVGYVVVHDLDITVCELKNVGQILDAVVSKDGVNRVRNVRFGSTGKEAEDAVIKARQLACLNAQFKADEYCKAFGVKKKVKSISESIVYPRGNAYERASAADMMRSTELAPSTISHRVIVNVTYELVD